MTDIIEKHFIVDFFKNQPTGKFLEIGSDDGGPKNEEEPFWGLAEQGWSGVYCEPNPISCAKLIKNVMPYGDKIKVFNGAVTPSSELLNFYLSIDTGGSSSFDPEWMKKQDFYLPEHRQYPIITNTVTLSKLLDFVGWDVDAISIDVEAKGNYVELMLADIDFTKLFNCKLICIEGGTLELCNKLELHGYKVVQTKCGNFIFSKPT